MTGERHLIDTVFVQAILSDRDQHHAKAMAFLPRLRAAKEAIVTEAVIVEVGDALCSVGRRGAADWINSCYRTGNVRVIRSETALLMRGLRLYESRSDKTWSLTDCISFVVMQDEGLSLALTADRHFIQAGFRALLLEEP